MDESTSAVRLPGAAARRFGHVCGFFHSREEEYRVLLPLAKEGFERGEKVFHIVDPEHRPERMRRLEEVGISPAAARRPGQVEIRAWEDAYLRGGRFDQEAMMTLLEETLRGAKADGFGQTRVWANMEWALGEFPGVEDLVEYETRVNYLLPKIRRPGRLRVRPHQIRRRRHDGCPPHPSAGHHRRVSPREPVLRATRRIPARTPRPRRVDSAELTGDVRSPETPGH